MVFYNPHAECYEPYLLDLEQKVHIEKYGRLTVGARVRKGGWRCKGIVIKAINMVVLGKIDTSALHRIVKIMDAEWSPKLPIKDFCHTSYPEYFL